MNGFHSPVMRLLGSNTSIFSRRSRAAGDMLGNLVENCCFLYCGSCLTYLRALSLRRNPRLASSGDPSSFYIGKRRKGTMYVIKAMKQRNIRLIHRQMERYACFSYFINRNEEERYFKKRVE